MTFDEYQNECLRTASMGLGPEIEMAVRALGLVGEVAEFRDACLNGSADAEVKEAGDVLWYAGALAAAFSVGGADLGIGELAEVPFCGGASFNAYCDTLMMDAAKLAELVKKQIGHKKPANRETVIRLLENVVRGLALGSIPNLDRIAKENVAKLKARYPNGWSTATASKKADSDEPAPTPIPIPHTRHGAVEAETPGHFPAGSMHFDNTDGEWKPGPV